VVFVVWCVMCDVWCVVCVFFLPQGHLTVALGVLFLYSKGHPTMALGVLFPLPRVSPHGGPRGAFSLSRGSPHNDPRDAFPPRLAGEKRLRTSVPVYALARRPLNPYLGLSGCGFLSQCTRQVGLPLYPQDLLSLSIAFPGGRRGWRGCGAGENAAPTPPSTAMLRDSDSRGYAPQGQG